MVRTKTLEATGALGLCGMRTALDGVLTTALKRQHGAQRVVGSLLEAKITRSRPARSSLPIHRRQAATGQGGRRHRLRRHGRRRGAGAEPRRQRLPRPSAQRRPRRRHPHGQDPTGHRLCPALHSRRHRRPFRQCRRPRQSARGRGAFRPPGRMAEYLTQVNVISLDEFDFCPSGASGGVL